MRRFFALLLSVCLVFLLALPAEAAAEQTPEDVILDACVYLREAELSEFAISVSEFEERFDALYCQGALPWYISGSYDYTYDTSSNRILSFTPDAILDGDIDMLAYEQKVAEILDTCVKPGMTDVQIALSLHDYIVINTVYDETLEKNTAYDLIVNGSSVCAGYAEAYMDLLTRAGVPCLYVTSEEMDHAWNLVSIDGSWYHVDVTWDDPSPDIAGYALHDHFLLTDREIASGEDPHSGWDTDTICDDTRFSDAWWRGVYSPVFYVDRDTCYLLRSYELLNSVYCRNEQTGEETLLYQEEDHYIDIGYGSYCYDHQGLALQNGRLYFNTMDAVQSADLATGEIRVEYAYGGNRYIGGFRIGGDTLYLTMLDHNSGIAIQTQSLRSPAEHIHSYTHTVTAPTCTEGGYTASVCDCGITFRSTPVAPVAHSNERSFGLTGITYTCVTCGSSYEESWIPEEYRFYGILCLISAASLLFRSIYERKRKS